MFLVHTEIHRHQNIPGVRDKITGLSFDIFLNKVSRSLDDGVKPCFIEDESTATFCLELLGISPGLNHLLSGGEKSISDIGAKGTVLNESGNQEQGSDVHDIGLFGMHICTQCKKNCCNMRTSLS